MRSVCVASVPLSLEGRMTGSPSRLGDPRTEGTDPASHQQKEAHVPSTGPSPGDKVVHRCPILHVPLGKTEFSRDSEVPVLN